MPSFWINGGAVAATIDFYRMVGIKDEERGLLYKPANQWNYQRRSRIMTWDRNAYFSLWAWPGGQFVDPDHTAGVDLLFGDHGLETGADWEPWRRGDKGTTRPYYIYGQVFDVNGNPVVGAVIDSFITATDVKDGTTASGADGTYQVPCYNRTAAHYVSAYKAGSPSDVAGESVNTLTPSV